MKTIELGPASQDGTPFNADETRDLWAAIDRASDQGETTILVISGQPVAAISPPPPSPDGGLGEDEEEDADPRPDVDGFVVLDGGAYHVSLARRPFGQYRRREFAVYELARAMAETGYFPPAWISGEHGPATESIDEEVHAHLIEGPDPALRPLPGVRFEPGDLVRVDNDSWPSWVVDADYGHLGLMLHTEGDPAVTVLTRTELVHPRTPDVLWEPEHPAGHRPFCAHPSHSLSAYCAADPADPPTMLGKPSQAWLRDHPRKTGE